MARKPKLQPLGNDPFRRGAAERPSPEATPAVDAAPAEGTDVAPGTEPRRPPRKKAARRQPQAKKATARASGGGADRTAGEAPPPAASTPPTQPRQEAPPRRAPAAPETAEPAAPAARRGAAPVREPAAAGPGLLPSNHEGAHREPAVVAVPLVPAAPVAGPPPTPREARAPGDAAQAAVVFLRQLLGLPARAPSFDVDELGFDPAFEEEVRPLLDWVFDRWFRVEVHGSERLPQQGPLILVANRAGALPWDSAMLGIACRRNGRPVRPLVEDAVFHFPALGVVVNRLGAVRACPENAERILDAGGAVAVFPEGATGVNKPFRERYRLQRFGRGGFAKLALRTGATVVPVSIVGSEEIHPLLARVPARPLGLPFVPITPTFPWLGLAGLLPLPAKWHIDIGAPVDLGGHGPDAAADDPLVLRLAEHVRATIQGMLDERLAQRHTVFGG